MNCPVCATALRPGLRFCDSCGARLEKACAGCGATNPLGARFCGACGAPFADSEPHADTGKTAPAQSAEEGERRQLTVMFVDLVGSTGLSGSLDPEQWRDILRAYQGVCAEAITRFGGKIQQYAGDGVFAYFGYPVAYDDAARRAVHAGHALLAGMHGLASTTRAQHSVELQARVGLHTGLVVVGEMGAGETRESGAIVGETPNIAARVQSLARPGTLALSAATHRLVEPAIRLRSLGRHALKGVTEPIELFEALEDAGEGVAPVDIVLYGESLGSGVAVQLAVSEPVGAVVLDAPYTSILNLALRNYFYLPVRPLLVDRYESDRRITSISAPVLIMHGRRDGLIPVEMGEALFAMAVEPKTLVVFPKGGHSDLDEYGAVQIVHDWLATIRSGK